MSEYPLLFFSKNEDVTRSKLPNGGNNYHRPTSSRQGTRLSSKFSILNDQLVRKNIQLQQGANGIIPEEVLVLETIGSVEDFIKAVKKINGLEWLGEIEINDIEPDDDFYDTAQRDKKLSGRLYLISTNSTAMRQLLSLWRQYVTNPDIPFQRGLGKFKDVFKILKDIRKWNETDRFEETSLLEFWKGSIEIAPEQIYRFEIELWYKDSPEKRVQSFTTVQNIITSYGGNVITFCDISEIKYHSILAELPANRIADIVNNVDAKLVKCENIMFFRPSGQIVMEGEAFNDELYNANISDISIPTGSPKIAIFDGYPLENHLLLQNRLIIDDPDNFNQYYQVEDRKHGTAMCSLIVKGDLSNNAPYISSPLYVRPIMKPKVSLRDRREFVPDNILLVDTIHKAVKRMFDGENGEEPTAPNVKIINLSIGDPDRSFYYTVSPLARLLDWLSYKYKILFIISAGNVRNEIPYDGNESSFLSLSSQEQVNIFVKSILNNRRNCRLYSPAESINNLTIGSTHEDFSTILENDRRHNPYNCVLPSTYTPIGGGYRKAIKPDFVCAGGRQMYEFDMLHGTSLRPSNYKRAPGILMAAPDNTLNKTIYDIGTSCSAALTSRNGLLCYNVLEQLMDEIDIEESYIPLLIKAMLVHGCSWDTISENIERCLDPSLDARVIKKIKNNWIGYGVPDIRKSIECTSQRATVIGFNKLEEGSAHIYELPLPPSLASKVIDRRLTITLAWFTPITVGNQRYRQAKLWFEAPNKIATKRINSDDKAVKRGTLQHEIFNGHSAEAFEDGDVIKIKVNCSKDAIAFPDSIHYALIVSLEVAEGVNLPIYNEIKNRIVIPITVR